MYDSYWQLNAKPFDNTSDAAFYYPSEIHQGAALKLRYVIENRKSAAALTGPAGLGKTLLVQTLLGNLSEQYGPAVHIVYPQMPPDQLLAYLATEIASTSDDHLTPTIQQSVRRLEQALRENAAAGRHALLVIDEAHLLADTGELESIRLLLNFEFEGQSNLTLLLVGQPSLLPALDRSAGLEERLWVKCLMRPFSLEETVSYVSHRMHAAGGQRQVFDNGALEAIHHLAHGIPRRINRLCDLALLIGYAEQHTEICAKQIEEVSAELVTANPE